MHFLNFKNATPNKILLISKPAKLKYKKKIVNFFPTTLNKNFGILIFRDFNLTNTLFKFFFFHLIKKAYHCSPGPPVIVLLLFDLLDQPMGPIYFFFYFTLVGLANFFLKRNTHLL